MQSVFNGLWHTVYGSLKTSPSQFHLIECFITFLFRLLKLARFLHAHPTFSADNISHLFTLPSLGSKYKTPNFKDPTVITKILLSYANDNTLRSFCFLFLRHQCITLLHFFQGNTWDTKCICLPGIPTACARASRMCHWVKTFSVFYVCMGACTRRNLHLTS